MFTISCQDVKIKLPENLIKQFDDIVESGKIGGSASPNPSQIFNVLGNFVGAETQRINSTENKNSIMKSFNMLLIENILNLILPSIIPHIGFIIDELNNKNANLNLEKNDIFPSTCYLQDNNVSEGDYNEQSSFSHFLINSIYSLLCSIILQTLVKEIKKLIKNALAKKAKEKVQRRIKKITQRSKFKDLSSSFEGVSGAIDTASSFDSIKIVTNFIDQA